MTPSEISIKLTSWLKEEASGCIFTIDQAYHALGVKKEEEKNIIRVTLHRKVKANKLERFENKWGVYRSIDVESEIIEILDKPTNPLPITFPGGVHQFVKIYPTNIIVVAGSSNSGKTAYSLNLAYDNRDRFDVWYWSSEMESDELTERLIQFSYPLTEWRDKIHFMKRTMDFHQVIKPDALNIVDYLEVKDGEFYKIGEWIRKIYEKLKEGIAVINLQMAHGKTLGWGGDKSLDKARLYFTLDDHRLTLTKVKCQKTGDDEVDPNGMGCDFRIVKGGSTFIWGQKWTREKARTR